MRAVPREGASLGCARFVKSRADARLFPAFPGSGLTRRRLCRGSIPCKPGAASSRPEPGAPLVVPEGAVVVPGARAVTVGKGREWGLSLATPVIVKYRDDRTDTRTELEAWIR